MTKNGHFVTVRSVKITVEKQPTKYLFTNLILMASQRSICIKLGPIIAKTIARSHLGFRNTQLGDLLARNAKEKSQKSQITMLQS